MARLQCFGPFIMTPSMTACPPKNCLAIIRLRFFANFYCIRL
jgi:hypothetical protein